MKDIDFDELDKAVNSLMATTRPSQPEQESKAETVIDVPVSSSTPVSTPEPQPAAVVKPVEPTPVAVTRPTPAAAPAVRRGRFMDMVQTSSAQPSRTPAVATASPSREGLAITPRSEAVVPVATIAPAPDVTETQPVDEPKKPVSFDTMPDPLDMATAGAEEPAAQDVPTPEPVSTTSMTSPDPSESPFLSDAKVEKRPLNPSLGHDFEQPAKEDSVPAVESVSVEQDTKGEDEPPVNPQVPELSSDLVAIESGTAVEATQAVDTAVAAEQVEPPSTPLGATSIAQQYKSKESSGDQSHAAIYDASQYPEPLSHPAKSKSGWLWVLWVIVLLGIGAGGAVLLYVLKIIP